jgi:FkbM family methyltransferase
MSLQEIIQAVHSNEVSRPGCYGRSLLLKLLAAAMKIFLFGFVKRVIQTLLGQVGYSLVNTRRFGWEPWQDIRSLLSATKPPLIMDVGAHTGQTLLAAKASFPAATVHCFEPDPQSLVLLRKVASQFERVHVHGTALGDRISRQSFHRNRESMTNSILPTSKSAAAGEVALQMETLETISVDTNTVDGFCETHAIDYVDLLKTDCQGFDLKVLQGAAAMTAGRKIRAIQCEAIFDDEYVNQGWFHEVLAYLSNRGYALVGLYHPARNGHQELTFADAVFKVRG